MVDQEVIIKMGLTQNNWQTMVTIWFFTTKEGLAYQNDMTGEAILSR